MARTIAKVLRFNEELTEAIALGHDLGHTPFGHAGERVLSALVPGGFNHYEQSLRTVDRLENDGNGLNLTWEVRDGIARHPKGKHGLPVGATEAWESLLTSVASLVAVQGVMVSAEVAGKVVHIAFEPGTMVKVGDLLEQQDTAAENAQLRSAEATVVLTKLSLERSRKLLSQKTSSQAEFDNADAQYKQAVAQADNIRAIIAKKTIRAPFRGVLGIRLVNRGQILSAGDAIVSLQSHDPIFVNFSLPQQQLSRYNRPYDTVGIRCATRPIC